MDVRGNQITKSFSARMIESNYIEDRDIPVGLETGISSPKRVSVKGGVRPRWNPPVAPWEKTSYLRINIKNRLTGDNGYDEQDG